MSGEQEPEFLQLLSMLYGIHRRMRKAYALDRLTAEPVFAAGPETVYLDEIGMTNAEVLAEMQRTALRRLLTREHAIRAALISGYGLTDDQVNDAVEAQLGRVPA